MDQRDDFNGPGSSTVYVEEQCDTPSISITDDAREYLDSIGQGSCVEPIFQAIQRIFKDVRMVRLDVLWDEDSPPDKPGVVFFVTSSLKTREFWDRTQEFFDYVQNCGTPLHQQIAILQR